MYEVCDEVTVVRSTPIGCTPSYSLHPSSERGFIAIGQFVAFGKVYNM